MNTILIACPIFNREWILPHFLERIKNIDYDKKLIKILFIETGSTDKTMNLLVKFRDENKELYKDIIIDIKTPSIKFEDERSNEVRMKYTYKWLGYLRTYMLSKTVKLDCDYLLSVDSDILVEPDIINNLLYAKQAIVSSIIYNGWILFPEKPYGYPNILNNVNNEWKHIVNNRTKFPHKNEPNTIIPVGMTGAVSLISKEVCKVAKYGEHPVGEDCAFSEDARKKGFESYCNISQLSHHIMSKEHLEKFLDGSLYFWIDK